MTALSEAILQSSVRLTQSNGLEGWSIERVARGAKCAKGLVIHHYQTRPNLLQATATRVARIRLDRRTLALEPGGTDALDALWHTIIEDNDSGLSRATFGLSAHGYRTRRADDHQKLHAAIAAALAISPDALADPIAAAAMLDGIEFALLLGADAEVVRRAFDRLWVTLIESD